MDSQIAAKFLEAVLAQPRVRRLLSTDHFSVDGTLIEAWASMKSFKPTDGSDPPPRDGGRNGESDFHGHKRSNATHASRDGSACAEFSWQRSDDGEDACGRGWVTFGTAGRLVGHFYIHDSGFVCERD